MYFLSLTSLMFLVSLPFIPFCMQQLKELLPGGCSRIHVSYNWPYKFIKNICIIYLYLHNVIIFTVYSIGWEHTKKDLR